MRRNLVKMVIAMAFVAVMVMTMLVVVTPAMATEPPDATQITVNIAPPVILEKEDLSYTQIISQTPSAIASGTCYWNMTSTTDWSDLHILPGSTYDFNITITVYPNSTSSFRPDSYSIGFWTKYGEWTSSDNLPAEILPGWSWTGKVGSLYILPIVPAGTVVTYPSSAFTLAAKPPAVPENMSIPIGITVWSSTPFVDVSTDKFEYAPSDTMTVTIDIANPTENRSTFEWYWQVPQFSICTPVMSVPIPAGYEDTLDFRFTIPNWGPKPFGNAFYIHLLDKSGEIIDADAACWAYSPSGKAMSEVDIAKEIKKTIERVELPS